MPVTLDNSRVLLHARSRMIMYTGQKVDEGCRQILFERAASKRIIEGSRKERRRDDKSGIGNENRKMID